MKSNLQKRPSHKDSGGALNPREPKRPLRRLAASRMLRNNFKIPPEDADAARGARIVQMLHGDHYWHDRIRRVLAEAGFITRRIEQEETHPVWIMHLTRASFDLATDNPTAAKQIRKVLGKGGVRIQRNELSIVSRSKDWIRCAFVLELGAPGVLK